MGQGGVDQIIRVCDQLVRGFVVLDEMRVIGLDSAKQETVISADHAPVERFLDVIAEIPCLFAEAFRCWRLVVFTSMMKSPEM